MSQIDTCGHNCRKLRGYKCSSCVDLLTKEQAELIVKEVREHEDLKNYFTGYRFNPETRWLFISTTSLPEYTIRAFLVLAEQKGLNVAITAKNSFDVDIMLTKKQL